MKNILSGIAFTLAATFLTSSLATATTTCPNPTTMAAYVPGGGSITCSTNNLTFSNFLFTSSSAGGASLPTPASVTVMVQDVLGNEGFRFNPGFIEGIGESQDVTVGFLVTAAPGTKIEDLFIGFNGAASGTGATDFTETYCSAGPLTGTCGNFHVVNGNINQHIDITPTDHLYITKDFGASGHSDGNASISAVINQYSNTSAVPEPASLSMMGLGLLGLGLIGRRRKV